LLLATDNEGRRVFYLLAKFCEVEILQGIVNWDKEDLTAEGVKKLLAKD